MNKYILKTIIIGDPYVGKSNILSRLYNDTFSNTSFPTIGVDFYSKLYTVNNINLKFQIWDTSGQSRYRSLTSAYYRTVDIVLICYDVNERTTFDNVINWYNQLKDINIDRKLIYIIGNKIDTDYSEVSIYELKELAEELGINYFEVSAKKNINIEELFIDICNKFLISDTRKLKDDAIVLKSNTINLKTKTKTKTNKCFCF